MSLQTKIHYLKGYQDHEYVEGAIELSISVPFTLKELYQTRFTGDSLPLQMTLLLDTSGSMKPSEDLLKISTSTLIKLIPLGTTSLRIITFDNDANEILKSTIVSTVEIQDEILNTTKNLKVSNGSTNMNAALQLLKPSSSYMQSIVMLSDGHANLGLATSSKELLNTVKSVLDESKKNSNTSSVDNSLPIVFTSIGFNEPEKLQMDILKDLASLTDGNLHIVQSPEKVQESFGDVMCDALTILAANVKFKSIDCELCSNITGKDKLNGLHLRYDAKRSIPFTIQGKDCFKNKQPSIEIQYKDVLQNSLIIKTILLPVPPVHQDINPEVDEACILSLASHAMKDILEAKELFLLAKNNLGLPPRPPFFSPFPGIGLNPFKRQALMNNNTTTEQTINQSYEKMNEIYNESCLKLEKEIIDPAKAKLKVLIDRIDQNPRKQLSILESLRKEMMILYQMEIDNTSLDERIQNLSYDLISQRAGVRDSNAPLGTLSIHSTPTQNVVRMLSNSLSQQPDIDAETATILLENSLEKKNI